MTCATAPVSRRAPGWGSPCCPRCRSPSPARSPRRSSTSGWTAGSAVTARVLIAAAVLVVPAADLAARTLVPRAPQRRTDRRVRPHRRRRVPARVLQRGRPHAGRRRDPDRVHLPRRRDRLAVVPARPAPQPAHGRRRRCSRSPGWCSCSIWCRAPTSTRSACMWALGAMAGAAFYWIISADEDNGLPGIVLAAGGLLLGGVVLLVAGLIGIVPLATSRADVVLAGTECPGGCRCSTLGVVTAAARVRPRDRRNPSAGLAAGGIRRPRPRRSPASCSRGCCSTRRRERSSSPAAR